MAFYHKWDVKFAHVLQFLSLISDGLGSAIIDLIDCPKNVKLEKINTLNIVFGNIDLVKNGDTVCSGFSSSVFGPR